jgi:hypothetical protein
VSHNTLCGAKTMFYKKNSGKNKIMFLCAASQSDLSEPFVHTSGYVLHKL